MLPRTATLEIPPSFLVNSAFERKALLTQIRRPKFKGLATLITYTIENVPGVLLQFADRKILVTTRPVRLPADITEHLLVKRNSDISTLDGLQKAILAGKWVAPFEIDLRQRSPQERQDYLATIRNSWKGFNLREENSNEGVVGLRPPQVGAVYATLAHWKITSNPATIVMPTGTGKTDTMIALMLTERPTRLMVVVPSDQLRNQIAKKFSELSFFEQVDLISSETAFPIVSVLKSKPTSVEEVDAVFENANVVITTMQVAGQCEDPIQKRMAFHCSHLFIDEAHHVAARTWDSFSSAFGEKRVIQFTATPFRNDGKPLPGKIIFAYPLRKAQSEGYFRQINFKPVREFTKERADIEIARKAVSQLTEDLEAGLDHLVMARVNSLVRADQLLAVYQEIGQQFGPRVINSSQSASIQDSTFSALEDRTCRIIICVDMLGEGFDLPELKIAAVHDMHKSLAITLQFTGRFTRTKPELGDASLIANIADPKVEQSLVDLYAEDADWNYILQNLSENATDEQILRSEFLRGFENLPNNLALQNVFPKMSAVVYRTDCENWRPESVNPKEIGVTLYAGPTTNPERKVLLYVTKQVEKVRWGWIREIQNTQYHLYLVYWNSEQKLLFINSSETSGSHEELAKQVGGPTSEIVRGERVYRALHGIKRLMLMNLGLSHLINRSIRFSMHSGSDITPELGDAHGQNKTKSNLFGRGYENGKAVTIGCSRKGKIWSYKIAWDMSEWVRWCDTIGAKLRDSNISTDLNMHSIIRPEPVETRPALVPIAIEWPDGFFKQDEEDITFDFGNGERASLEEVEMNISSQLTTGPITFSVQCPIRSLGYQIEIGQNGMTVRHLEREILVTYRRKTIPLSQLFMEEGPIVRFADSSALIYNEFYSIPQRGERAVFSEDKIVAWDWTGTNLRSESQTHEKHADSIQRKVILDLLNRAPGSGYQVICDDDGKGESADVVTFAIVGSTLKIQFFHCKWTSGDRPGARLKDLYEVCGQAQKSVFWKAEVEKLMKHILRRDEKRTRDLGVSRFELGDPSTALRISHQSRYLHVDLKMFIVQPGLTKAGISPEQSELLAATELYLKETYAIGLEVICSP